jgi:hypothetical protein
VNLLLGGKLFIENKQFAFLKNSIKLNGILKCNNKKKNNKDNKDLLLY